MKENRPGSPVFLRDSAGNHTVLLKMSPVNSYMSDVIRRGLRPLLEEGLRN